MRPSGATGRGIFAVVCYYTEFFDADASCILRRFLCHMQQWELGAHKWYLRKAKWI